MLIGGTSGKCFARKFATGRKFIPTLFEGIELPSTLDQIALLAFGSSGGRLMLGRGKLVMICDFMQEIRIALEGRGIDRSAVPEQVQLLRALQFATNYW